MFKPNCVIATIAPEATLKSHFVRRFIEKKLRENIRAVLKNSEINVDSIDVIGARFVIITNKSEEAFELLKKCFGIYELALAQKEVLVELEDIADKAGEISEFSEGSFAIKGKSYSKKFKSKLLEEECGGKVLEKAPALKVNLSNPDYIIYCLAGKAFTIFFLEKVFGSKGMPIGSQGRVIIIGGGNCEKLGWFLMKNGCAITSENKLEKLEEWNSKNEIKVTSLENAKELYLERKITAFFTAETEAKKIKEISKKVGTKVFAPLIVDSSKTPFD